MFKNFSSTLRVVLKHKKYNKRFCKGKATRLNKINRASYIVPGWFDFFIVNKRYFKANHLEIARVLLSRGLRAKRSLGYSTYGIVRSKVLIRLPITQKPLQTRMGKGKGSISNWVGVFRNAQLFYRIISRRTRTETPVLLALIQLSKKFPFMSVFHVSDDFFYKLHVLRYCVKTRLKLYSYKYKKIVKHFKFRVTRYNYEYKANESIFYSPEIYEETYHKLLLLSKINENL